MQYNENVNINNMRKNCDENHQDINSYYDEEFLDSYDNDDFININLHNVNQNFDIFSDIYLLVEKIENSDVKENTKAFIKRFKEIISLYNEKKDISENVLPKIVASESEDGSFLLEWIFKDFRIVFDFESELSESYWFLVTNSKLKEFSMSGDLNSDKIDIVIKDVINFVLQNT